MNFGIETMLVVSYGLETETMMNTKYKTMAKKVKPMATQLPPNSKDHIRNAEEEHGWKEIRHVGHKFTEERLAKLDDMEA